LTAITPLLKEPKSNEAYRVDQAAWMLQAKLYMNAKVYIGSDNYAAVPLITKITGSNYALHTNYNNCFWLIMIKMELKMNLFLPLRLTFIQTYGGTTFLTHAPVGGSMDASAFGINGGWRYQNDSI
jgi:hypothetical protein